MYKSNYETHMQNAHTHMHRHRYRYTHTMHTDAPQVQVYTRIYTGAHTGTHKHTAQLKMGSLLNTFRGVLSAVTNKTFQGCLINTHTKEK